MSNHSQPVISTLIKNKLVGLIFFRGSYQGIKIGVEVMAVQGVLNSSNRNLTRGGIQVNLFATIVYMELALLLIKVLSVVSRVESDGRGRIFLIGEGHGPDHRIFFPVQSVISH